jgi:bifunctional non-homologous end joining protein LigD
MGARTQSTTASDSCARRDGDRVRIFSRHGREWTDKVPAIVAAIAALPAESVTLDGEAVICDAQGVSDFEALRIGLARRQGSSAAFLYAFDILELDGRDLRPDAWESRREALAARLHKASDGIRLPEHLEGHGALMYRRACGMGLEGIVSKRRDAPYRSGRSRDWVKVKNPGAPAATRRMNPQKN